MPNYRKLVEKAVEAVTGIRAYHGSPHDFERFDLSKIGTGEGAASYGRGLYFAENPTVATEYRTRLAQPADDEQLRTLFGNLPVPKETYGAFRASARQVAQEGADPLKHAFYMQTSTPELRDPGSMLEVGPTRRALADALQRAAEIQKGKMYEVNIRAKPEEFLDWDRPLAQQSETVRSIPQLTEAAKTEAYGRALAATHQRRADELWSMVKDPLQAPGGFAYQNLSPRLPGGRRDVYASDLLRDAGIPGIRYADQGSRDLISALESARMGVAQSKPGSPGHEMWSKALAGLEGGPPPTRNYVLFRDDIIDILKKYMVPGVPAGLGAGSVLQQPTNNQ